MKFFVLWLLIFFCCTFGTAQKSLDYRILHNINKNTYPRWDEAMRKLSFSVYLLEPIPPVGISLQGYFTKDKEMLWNGYKSAISLCFALSVSTALKYSIRRDRPYTTYPNDIIRRDHTGTPSFPSGHTTAAFATATAISLTYNKWYITVPSYLYASLAAYSRMRLGMHYPSDVLGGIVLGTGTTLLTWHLAKKIRQNRIKPLPPQSPDI